MHQNSDYKIYFPQIVSNTLEPKGNQQSYCKLHTRYSTFVLLPDTQRMTFRLNKLLEIPIYTFLVSVDTFKKRRVFFCNSAASNHGSHFTHRGL